MTGIRRSAAALALLALGSWVVAASAAPPPVPAKISYQGLLLDGVGDARTGNVALTLRIYDSVVGGTLLYK